MSKDLHFEYSKEYLEKRQKTSLWEIIKNEHQQFKPKQNDTRHLK